MQFKNKIRLSFSAISQNESFARSVIACFALQLNPSVSDLTEIKTSVSEAVTNAIVHGYGKKSGMVNLEAYIEQNTIHIKISDNGIGIEDIEKAIEPFYTTRPDEERTGMGFTIMQSFMDSFEVKSVPGRGTKIYMTKIVRADA